MTSPQEAFSKTVAAFLESTDNEERNHAEQWLLEWEKDINSLPLALEIIDISFNLNDVFFSSRAIYNILSNNSEQLDSGALDKIFIILQRRFLHSLQPGLDEKCRNSIARNLACVTTINLNYIDKNWNDSSNLDDVILYYAFLTEYYNMEYSDYPNKPLKDCLTSESRVILMIQYLSKAPITPAWLDLLKFIAQLINDDESGDGPTCNSDIIYEFLPDLQTIPTLYEQNNIYSKFLDLLEVILTEETFSVGYSIDTPFAQEIMAILVNMVDKLYEEEVDHFQALQFASIVWELIIDYDYEFFKQCISIRPEFVGMIFEKFLVSMRLLIEEPTEFVKLLKISKFKFNPIVRNKNDFLPFIFQLLDVIILAINTDYDEFINDEENRNFISDSISVITNFFDKDDIQEDFPESVYLHEEFTSEFKKIFDEYYEEKIKDFSDGIIFTVASSTKTIRKTFAPIVAAAILESDPIPQSALLFVSLSVVDIGDSNFDGIISLSYSSYIDEPNIPALQAIAQIIIQKPKLFDDNATKLIMPIVTWLQESPPSITPYIMSCLIYYLMYTYQQSSQLQNVEDNLSSLTSVICEQVSTLLSSDLSGMFAYISEVIDISSSIIKLIKPPTENEEASLADEDNMIIQFFCQLFNHFVTILEPLWHAQSDQVMISLCEFLIKSHKARIITDYEQFIKWISEALSIAPVIDHIKLLRDIKNLYDLLPESSPILEFIVSFPQIEDSELQYQVYSFIFYLFNNKWPNFFDCFEIGLLLSPMTSDDNRMVKISIELIQLLINSDVCNDFIGDILGVIIGGMLISFQMDSIKNSVQILIEIIISQKAPLEKIGEIVHDNLKSEISEAGEFLEVLSQINPANDPATQEQNVLKAAKKMIFAHRNIIEARKDEES